MDLIEKLEQPKVEPPKEEKIEKVESIPELPVEPAEENVQVVESIPELPTSGIPEIVEESPTPVEKIETIDVLAKEKEESEREAARQAVREALHNIPDDGRFKKTEVISPVFGRMETKEAEYPTVKKFNHEENTSSIQNIEELPSLPKSDMIKPEATEKVASLDELIENDKEKEVSKTTDLSKNEDLLKALKDFRDSL